MRTTSRLGQQSIEKYVKTIDYTTEEISSCIGSSGRKNSFPEKNETADWLGEIWCEFPPKLLKLFSGLWICL